MTDAFISCFCKDIAFHDCFFDKTRRTLNVGELILGTAKLKQTFRVEKVGCARNSAGDK